MAERPDIRRIRRLHSQVHRRTRRTEAAADHSRVVVRHRILHSRAVRRHSHRIEVDTADTAAAAVCTLQLLASYALLVL